MQHMHRHQLKSWINYHSQRQTEEKSIDNFRAIPQVSVIVSSFSHVETGEMKKTALDQVAGNSSLSQLSRTAVVTCVTEHEISLRNLQAGCDRYNNANTLKAEFSCTQAGWRGNKSGVESVDSPKLARTVSMYV